MNGKKILVTASISVTVVGLICGLVYAIKSVRIKDDREKTSKNNNPANTKTKEEIDLTSISQDSIPNGILEDEYETAEALLKDVLYYYLSQSKFNNPDDLLEKTIRACGLKIGDYSWYDQLPKNIEELEDKIETFEYGVIYRRGLLETQQK